MLLTAYILGSLTLYADKLICTRPVTLCKIRDRRSTYRELHNVAVLVSVRLRFLPTARECLGQCSDCCSGQKKPAIMVAHCQGESVIYWCHITDMYLPHATIFKLLTEVVDQMINLSLSHDQHIRRFPTLVDRFPALVGVHPIHRFPTLVLGIQHPLFHPAPAWGPMLLQLPWRWQEPSSRASLPSVLPVLTLSVD